MKKLVIMLAAVLALAAAACGSDDPADTTSADSVLTDILTPTETTPPRQVTEPTTTPSTAPVAEQPVTTTAVTLPPVDEIEPVVAALTPDSIVTLRALGTVRVGMSMEEASGAAGLELRRDLGRASTDSCYYASAGPTMRGVSFMVVNGSISRIDIDSPSPAATRSGVRIGTSEGDLREAYPDNIQRADDAVSSGRAWAFVPNDDFDADFRIYFEIEDGSVARFRLGIKPAVDYLDGCEEG